VVVDSEFVAVLFALLEEYRPERLEALLEDASDTDEPDSSGLQEQNR